MRAYMETSDKIVLSLIVLSIVAVLGSTAWSYLFQKNYSFIVEAPCDPETETCFYRDCEEEYCPPNALSNFRMFSVLAKDFPNCLGNSCLTECISGTLSCEEIVCGTSSEDICGAPPDTTETIDQSSVEEVESASE